MSFGRYPLLPWQIFFVIKSKWAIVNKPILTNSENCRKKVIILHPLDLSYSTFMVFIQIMMVLVYSLDFFPLCLIVFWHEIFLFMTILFSNFALLPWIWWGEALMSSKKLFYIIWPLLIPWRCLSLANHLKQVERYISLLWWHSFMFVFFWFLL